MPTGHWQEPTCVEPSGRHWACLWVIWVGLDLQGWAEPQRGLHSFMTGREPRRGGVGAGVQGLPGGGCEAMAPRQHSWQLWGTCPPALAPTLTFSPVDLGR